MNKKDIIKMGKDLSYHLRHNIDLGGYMDESGFIDISKLPEPFNDLNILDQIIEWEDNSDNKKSGAKSRFQMNPDRTQIRARSGHSIPGIYGDLNPVDPDELPEILYHGTSLSNWNKIVESGSIKPMSRNYVNLTDDYDTAVQVAKRHDPNEYKVFELHTSDLIKSNVIYKTGAGVYLTTKIKL